VVETVPSPAISAVLSIRIRSRSKRNRPSQGLRRITRQIDNLSSFYDPLKVVRQMASKVETVTFESRRRWRKWLRANHSRRKEIWLVLPKKAASGISYRVYYDEALEEAICYGWIDSRIRSLDPTRSMVRFSPRKSKIWSPPNLQRALELLRKGKMTRAGLATLPEMRGVSS